MKIRNMIIEAFNEAATTSNLRGVMKSLKREADRLEGRSAKEKNETLSVVANQYRKAIKKIEDAINDIGEMPEDW